MFPRPRRRTKSRTWGDLSRPLSARVGLERGSSLQPDVIAILEVAYVIPSQARLLRRLRRVDALRLLRLRGSVHRPEVARVAAHRAGQVADGAPRACGRARAPARAVPVLDASAAAQ